MAKVSLQPVHYSLPIFLAAIMSVLSSKYIFVGSALNLIPWGFLAFGFGLLTKNKASALKLGSVYGFSQSFIFLWLDKSGITTISQFLILFMIILFLSLLAAACGWIVANLGWKIRQKIG